MTNISDYLKELIDKLEDNENKWLIIVLILIMTNKNKEIDEETKAILNKLLERKENK